MIQVDMKTYTLICARENILIGFVSLLAVVTVIYFTNSKNSTKIRLNVLFVPMNMNEKAAVSIA